MLLYTFPSDDNVLKCTMHAKKVYFDNVINLLRKKELT